MERTGPQKTRIDKVKNQPQSRIKNNLPQTSTDKVLKRKKMSNYSPDKRTIIRELQRTRPE